MMIENNPKTPCELLVIVPSRGRPHAAAELAAAFAELSEADSRLVFVVDSDDPDMAGYGNVTQAHPPVGLLVNTGPRTMVAALNVAATALLASFPNAAAVAFMGDDHRPRTAGWDAAYLGALATLGTGIVYGDDLLQHENIPTQVAMTADIIRTLGHMAPPPLTHLFVDNYWKDLGAAAGCLRYLPNVVVEHLHPFAGKAEWDAGHRRVNTPSMYGRDQAAYSAYAAAHLADDIAKVRALR